MTAPSLQLDFIKLNVEAMEPALAFWRDAFGFGLVRTIDKDDFLEHILTLPGQEQGPRLMLLQHKDGRSVELGNGYGPIGFICADIAASSEHLVRCGATVTKDIVDIGNVKFGMLESPQGHGIELVERVAA